MSAKRIVFIIMCVLLAATVAVVGIVAWRVSHLLGAFGALLNPPEMPTESVSPTDEPTDPPTDPPTEPPTDPPHEHYFLPSKIQKPTCETSGWTIYKCSCGESKVADLQNSLGHSWDGGTVIAVTCETDGHTRYTCTRCGRTEERNLVDKLGHDMSVVVELPATCTEDAKKTTSCSRDGCTYKVEQITTGSALGHNWGPEQREEPTCTEDGYILKECTNEGCEEEQKEALPATGHSFGPWQEVEGGHKEAVCSNANCDTTVSSADLKITKQYSAETTHYIFEVGTDDISVVLTYHVVDNRADELRNSNPLTFGYDAATGFCVTYEKAAGGEETKTLDALEGGNLAIEDAPPTQTEPENTEPENTEPNTTEPDTTEPDNTEPPDQNETA